MKRKNLWNLLKSRMKFRRHYEKTVYVENLLRKHLHDLCREFNIDEVPFRCSNSYSLFCNANIMRAAKGIAARKKQLSEDSYMTTMHSCEYTKEGKTHNHLVGIIANMDNIMKIVRDADRPYLVDEYSEVLRMLMKHEIGHVIVEGSIYENLPPVEAMRLLESRNLEAEKAMVELRKIKGDRSFVEGYFQLKRESDANAAVGITLEDMCDVYSKIKY